MADLIGALRRAGGALHDRLSRPAELHVLLPIVALVLLALVWGTALQLIRIERTITNAAAASSSVELAETFEAQVVRALREIDQTLRFIKYVHERNRGVVDLADLNARGLLLRDPQFVVSIVDRSGEIVSSTDLPEVKNVADQDYFRSLRERDSLAVGRPQRDADGDGWTLNFGRRLNTVDGSFFGIVTLSVPAKRFVTGYDPIKLGERGVLAIVGTDGIFRARRTSGSITAGDATDYAALVQGGNRAGVRPVVTVNPWDGVRRYTSARALADFPVAVVIGLSEDEQLAEVNRSTNAYIWGAAGGSVLLVLVLGGLARLSLTRLRAIRALEVEIAVRRQAETALNLRNRAIESSVNAIVITDALRSDHPIEYVNPAFQRITGYTAMEAIGRGTRFLLGTDAQQDGIRAIEAAIDEQREGHAVLRNYRKDGTLFWNEYYIAPVRAPNGEVTHFVGVMNDVTEAKRYEEQLSRQANFDTLTGLANRNLLKDRLRQAISNARRYGGTVVVAFLDIDNFKVVNDTLGHNMGDKLLCSVADRLKSCVRESDTVARQGGDEFVLILVNNPLAGGSTAIEAHVTVLMQTLLTNVAQPLLFGNREIRPTCSIGVSIFPQDGENADTLLRNADAAMYRAKELGRNRFQFFTADMHERIRLRMELESSLRQGLRHGEFELFYQPQVELKTGRIIGAEALLRWRHPEKGLIGPGHFIQFAEENGLIVAIGKWALFQACAQNKAWQDAGLPRLSVAVNMSARQCEQEDIDWIVKRALEAAGLEAQYLEVEITESVSMANPEQSVPLMTRLKETGVGLSIDDFGTGFSNLSYLKRFPVDSLKIDQSFVREITTDPGSLAISDAIITMSHSLNLKVVAEGVETKEQLELLRARGCDLIQGYYISRPVPADAFAALLAENDGYSALVTDSAPRVAAAVLVVHEAGGL